MAERAWSAALAAHLDAERATVAALAQQLEAERATVAALAVEEEAVAPTPVEVERASVAAPVSRRRGSSITRSAASSRAGITSSSV